MKLPVALVLVVCLSACNFFRGDEEIDLLAPVELENFDPQLEINRLWRQDLGDGPGDIRPMVVPAIDGDILYAGDYSGSLTAIDLTTGKRLWRTQLRNTRITGATGAGHGLVLVGTDKGLVIALDQTDGEQLWTATIASEILAPPATNGDTVVALSLDGKVYGLDARDGSERWVIDTSMPLLTLRGTAPPTVVEAVRIGPRLLDVVFVGHDNGKIAAYSMQDGLTVWDTRVGVPEGRTDLERMVDVDGQPLFHNGTLYGVSYQGGLMAIQPETGRALWFQDASSVSGPAAFAGTLAITEADGRVRAFNASEGTELWSSSEYAHRQLNAPAVANRYVAFADFEGYLHFLDRRTGETIGRRRVDGSGVRSPTIGYGDQVILIDNSGGIAAYRVSDID